LTDLFPAYPIRRGRHTALSDAQLQNRRDQFVQIFEGEWGQIGWGLQRCRKTEDLFLIFSPLMGNQSWISQVIEVFCRPCLEEFFAPTLRKLRYERRRIAGSVRVADETDRILEQQLQRVNWAFEQAQGRSYRIVKRARKQKRKEFWKGWRKHRDLAAKGKSLEGRIKDLEGSFAREELVRFIKSKRYELTPLHIANAVAGIPHMGWRQSMRRTSISPSRIADGRPYQIFKAIRYLVETSTMGTTEGLVKGFRDGIRSSLRSRYKLAREELAKNWFYLERAIHQSLRAKAQRKTLPFEMTKRYFNNIRSLSHVDMVLAEQARIILPKPRIPAS
jgi:hypothetical protein